MRVSAVSGSARYNRQNLGAYRADSTAEGVRGEDGDENAKNYER